MDIGATEIVACVPGDETKRIVKAFGNYTVDLQAIGTWLHEHDINTVAMESTGVYWIPSFEQLERQGFECLLISSRSLRRVPGRKSDIQTRSMERVVAPGIVLSQGKPCLFEGRDIAPISMQKN